MHGVTDVLDRSAGSEETPASYVPYKLRRIFAAVETYVREHPGATRSELAGAIRGNNGAIVGAVKLLLADHRIHESGSRTRRRLWPAGWSGPYA
jgi:hypothetical protein